MTPNTSNDLEEVDASEENLDNDSDTVCDNISVYVDNFNDDPIDYVPNDNTTHGSQPGNYTILEVPQEQIDSLVSDAIEYENEVATMAPEIPDMGQGTQECTQNYCNGGIYEGSQLSYDKSQDTLREKSPDSGVPGSLSRISDKEVTVSGASMVVPDTRPTDYLTEGEYTVENETVTRKLEVRIKIPSFIMLTLESVLNELWGLADRFNVYDKIVRIEEIKRQARTFRVAEISRIGKLIGGQVTVRFFENTIEIKSVNKILLNERHLVHALFEEVFYEILEAIMKRPSAENDPLEGECVHPGCAKNTMTSFICAICKRFLHGDSKCSNRGNCKRKCSITEKVSFKAS